MKGSEVKRNHDIMKNKWAKIMDDTLMYSSKNLGRKRERKKQNELLAECGKLMINSGKMRDLTSYPFTKLS